MLIIIFIFSVFQASENDTLGPYTSKTYLYLGDSFVTRYKSKIDTLKFTWADSFSNGNLIKRYYPAYMQDFERTEEYQYDNENRILRTTIQTKSKLNKSFLIDSIVYDYPDASTITETKILSREGIWMRNSRTVGDTTFTDQYINKEYGFTVREFWDSESRKHDQIIKPELSEVETIYVYNEANDLIEIIRVEEGSIEISMTISYKYDVQGRIIDKETFYGKNKELGSKEITIYE